MLARREVGERWWSATRRNESRRGGARWIACESAHHPPQKQGEDGGAQPSAQEGEVPLCIEGVGSKASCYSGGYADGLQHDDAHAVRGVPSAHSPDRPRHAELPRRGMGGWEEGGT